MKPDSNFRIEIKAEVTQAVRQHARANMDQEICGVLIGSMEETSTKVEAHIPGAMAAQGGAHVTFTQQTWEHIYAVKDRQFPQAKIVGWYHSHPGFGVFLSEYDLFIHQNFFANPGQVAWVYDPHSDEEGCFGWISGKVGRVGSLAVTDERAQSEGLPVAGGGAPSSPTVGQLAIQVKNQKVPMPGWRKLIWAGLLLLSFGCMACIIYFKTTEKPNVKKQELERKNPKASPDSSPSSHQKKLLQQSNAPAIFGPLLPPGFTNAPTQGKGAPVTGKLPQPALTRAEPKSGAIQNRRRLMEKRPPTKLPAGLPEDYKSECT